MELGSVSGTTNAANQQQKVIDNLLSQAADRITNLERFEKEIVNVSDRLERIGLALNESAHPSRNPKAEPTGERGVAVDPVKESNRPTGVAGRILEMGEYSETINQRFTRLFNILRTNLDYLETLV